MARRAGAPAAAQPGSPSPTRSPAPARFLGCFPGFHQRAAARRRRDIAVSPSSARGAPAWIPAAAPALPGLSRPLCSEGAEGLRRGVWMGTATHRHPSPGCSAPAVPVVLPARKGQTAFSSSCRQQHKRWRLSSDQVHNTSACAAFVFLLQPRDEAANAPSSTT